MLNIFIVYIILVVLFFIGSALIVFIEEGYIKELLMIVFLNVFYLLYLGFIKLLRYFVKNKGLRVLGREPYTVKDYVELGADASEYTLSLKNQIRILFHRAEDE